MLASIESDSFSDNVEGLAAMFEDLAARFPLFAPFAGLVDAGAVSQAFQTLETNKFIEHSTGRYVLTKSGRSYCLSSKQTLFNRADMGQLEEAARVFNTL